MNGIEINVSESDFKSKPTEDQLWMLYLAVCKIEKDGCRWERFRNKKVYSLAVIAGFFGGIIGHIGEKFTGIK